MNPLARNTDPITSDEAAEVMVKSGTLAWQKSQVMAMMKQYSKFYGKQDIGPTSAELACFFQEDRYMVARRLPDLEKNGLVRKVGIKRCPVSKRNAVAWGIV